MPMNSTTSNVSFRALTWWASMARYLDIHALDIPPQLRLPQVVVDRLDADHASRPAPLRLHREIARVGAHIQHGRAAQVAQRGLQSRPHAPVVHGVIQGVDAIADIDSLVPVRQR